MDNVFNVVEIFTSIDGEGCRAGEPTVFLRFAGCNLRCSFCDSEYSWGIENSTEMTYKQIINKVNIKCNSWIKNITVTGGEPLLNPAVDKLLLEFCNLGYNVNVETNGSIVPRVHHPNLFYTIDYKCIYSGMNEKMNMSIYENLTDKDIVKFVVADEEDLLCTLPIVTKYPWIIYYYSPVFGKIELKQIVDFILRYRLNNAKLQVQLHKLVWDPQQRGV